MTLYTPTIISFEDEMRLEREHAEDERKAKKNLQWLKSCPEAIPRVKELIQETLAQQKKLEQDYQDHARSIKEAAMGEYTTQLRLAFIERLYVPRIAAIKKEVARLRRELSVTQPPTAYTSNQLNVEKAKEVQLSDIVNEFTDLVRPTSRNTLTIRCPFHEPDHHPSCVIYTATNSFCCYACGVKGDVITFIEKAFGYDFREAVKWLEGRAG